MILQGHLQPDLLERFLRGEASRAERRSVVVHLLKGCQNCLEVTRSVWGLADRRVRTRSRQGHLHISDNLRKATDEAS